MMGTEYSPYSRVRCFCASAPQGHCCLFAYRFSALLRNSSQVFFPCNCMQHSPYRLSRCTTESAERNFLVNSFIGFIPRIYFFLFSFGTLYNLGPTQKPQLSPIAPVALFVHTN